ncbi:MAG: AAA family ATPase, partial [Acidimicrobiia bacterium]
ALDLPDPEEVLADPASVRLPERGDRLYALLQAIAAAVGAQPTVDRWEAAFAVIGRAAQQAPDVAAAAARALALSAPPGAAAPVSAAALAPILSRAGLLVGFRHD